MDDYETEHGRDYASFDEEKFWFDIETEYYGVRHLVRDVHRETEEEAIEGDYRGRKKQISKYEDEIVSEEENCFEVLRRFRNSSDLDQFDYYLDRADSLLDRAYELIQERNLTLEFVRVWTDLQKYHGFAIAHYLTSLDDYVPLRTVRANGKKRTAEANVKKAWVAKLILHHMSLLRAQGQTQKLRTAANMDATETIKNYKKKGYNEQFDSDWFQSLLGMNRSGHCTGLLSGSYTGGNLKTANLEEWAAKTPDSELPPVVLG